MFQKVPRCERSRADRTPLTLSWHLDTTAQISSLIRQLFFQGGYTLEIMPHILLPYLFLPKNCLQRSIYLFIQDIIYQDLHH